MEIRSAVDTLDLSQMGGKGYALARLSAGSVLIPKWIAITPPSEGDIRKLECLSDYRFSQDFMESLSRHLKDFEGTELFAVRSSAIDEDGSEASFAGQFESFLNVKRDELTAHIIKVWESAFNDRVNEYRSIKKMDGAVRLPAVLVQQMVDADLAGVAFSVDVVSGSWATAIVSGVRGLGEKLVSGEVDGDTWHVDRDGIAKLVTQDLSEKSYSIDASQAAKIADLARRCERFFGVPQDIEWALSNGVLYLLQSRPITTLHKTVDPLGFLNIWDNSNIAESYGGVTTPLTFSFAHYIYKEVYQQFCIMMHVPRNIVEQNRSIFNGMLGLIQGRVYYNLMSWYRALALLPGFRLNHKFMEQMMGVKEGMPESVLAEFQDSRLGARVKDGLRLGWAMVGLAKAQLMLPRMIRQFYEVFNQSLDSIKRPVEELRPDELTEHFHQMEERLLTRWNAPLVNDFFAMVYFGILRGLTKKWCGDEDGTLQNGLLCGTGNIISAEPAKRIHEMAKIAAERPDFVRCLLDESLVKVVSAIQSYEAFSTQYESYLDRFADRCLNELKLESPTLRDDPLPLLRSVGSLAKRILDGHKASDRSEHALQEQAEVQVSQLLKRRPLRKLFFNYVLRQARHRVRDRENLRFERTRLFGRIRAIFMELGKRLAAFNVLEDHYDVVYLEIYEIIGFVEGTATTTDLKQLVSLRKAEFARFGQSSPPADRFETKGVVNIGNKFMAVRTPSVDQIVHDQLKGIGCCPGIVRGKARVVRDPAGIEICPGEILVAEQTDPGWITLFPASSGVLVERGSLLSHSAIVSREMGIPSVVSLSGLMDWLKTGDEIEMDGTTGTVRLLEAK